MSLNPQERARWRRPPEPSNTLKELGLRTLASLLDSLKTQKAGLSAGATERLLRRLKGLFDKVQPGSLFQDWSPPAAQPDVAVSLKAADLAADSERSSTNGGVKQLAVWFCSAARVFVHGARRRQGSAGMQQSHYLCSF